MKICSKCVLPETFPGIYFDKEGQCSYCSLYRGTRNQQVLKTRFKDKFHRILMEHQPRRPYDALVAYSGGKDSTYTLRLLIETYQLKVLAITFNHGFISPTAMENIQRVTNHLHVDHEYVSPQIDTIKEVFVKSLVPNIYPLAALKRASAVCISCMNLIKSYLIKKAIETKVPFVVYGWSPGQAPLHSSVFKTNPLTIRQMQKAIVEPFKEMLGTKLSELFLKEQHYLTSRSPKDDGFPYFIHPLAFLSYDEQLILNNIQEIGWVAPKDTDSNSTNCLLNSFAIDNHIRKYGFHPYAHEIAGLVREGYLTRDQGLEKLSKPPDPEVIDFVKKRLHIEEYSTTTSI